MKFLFMVMENTDPVRVNVPIDLHESKPWTSYGIFPHSGHAHEACDWFLHNHLPINITRGWVWVIPVPPRNFLHEAHTHNERRIIEILGNGPRIFKFERKGFVTEEVRVA